MSNSESMTKTTLERVELALAVLQNRQKDILIPDRIFKIAEIIEVDKKIHPSQKPLSRSAFSRNEQVRVAIAAASGEHAEQFDISGYASWHPIVKESSQDQKESPSLKKNRRAFLRKKSVRWLAQHVVALEELECFFRNRRHHEEMRCAQGLTQTVESMKAIPGFQPRDSAVARFRTYVNKVTKQKLIGNVIRLEASVRVDWFYLMDHYLEYFVNNDHEPADPIVAPV